MESDASDLKPKTSGGKSSQKNDTAEKLLELEDILQDIPPHSVSLSLNRIRAHKNDGTVSATLQQFGSARTDASASFPPGSMTQPADKAAHRGGAAPLGAQAFFSLRKAMESGCSLSGERNHSKPASKLCSDSVCEGHERDGDDDLLAALFPETTRNSASRDHEAARPSPRAMTEQQSSSPAASKKPPAFHTEPRERTYISATAGLKESRENAAAERNSRATFQRHNGGSTKQTSLNSGFPSSDTDLEDILNLPSSSQSGESSCFTSGVSAGCTTRGNGNKPTSPSTCRWNFSAVVRQEDCTTGSAERATSSGRHSARLRSHPLTSNPLAATHAPRAKVGRSSSLMSDSSSVRVDIGVPGAICPANVGETAAAHGSEVIAPETAVSAAADEAAAAADEAAAAADEAAAAVPNESTTALQPQIELLRTENQELHLENRRLRSRLQIEIQAAEATSQRKLLGKHAEWEGERDRYEGRVRMLEKELDRLRDQQTHDAKTYQVAMKAFEEERRMRETEEDKKHSRLLKAAIEKEQHCCEATLREKTAEYSQELKQTERRYRQQLEEQKKLFEDRVEIYKHQASAQRELHGLLEHVKSSATSIEQLTERLATQAAQETSTLSTQMAQRDGALQEIEQRLKEQQQQSAKQHSALVALATHFRKDQKVAEKSLAKEKERLDAERTEVQQLRHMLDAAGEEQRKAFDEFQKKVQGEKQRWLRQQNEKVADHDRREQRLKLLESHLRREKQSLEEQTHSLEEIRARATARLQDLENEVSEERQRLIQERDAARAEHLQLLQMRQELELKHGQVEAEHKHVQEERREVEDLLKRMQQESAEAKQLRAEATKARASIDVRGRHLDQKQVRCAEQIEQLQSAFKLVQKERLQLLRHESRLLNAGVVEGSGLKANSRIVLDDLSLVEHQLPRLVGVSTPFSTAQEEDQAIPNLPPDLTGPPPSGRKVDASRAIYSTEQQIGLHRCRTHESGIKLKTISNDLFTSRPNVKVRLCAAPRSAERPSTVASIAFTTVPSSQKALWRMRHPRLRAVDPVYSTRRTARLVDMCPSPLEDSWIPMKQFVATSLARSNSTPTERQPFSEQSSRAVEKAQGQLKLQTFRKGVHCLRLSHAGLTGKKHCPALSDLCGSTGLSVSAWPSRTDSGVCCVEESGDTKNCTAGNKHFMSVVVVGAHEKTQESEAAAHMCRSLKDAVLRPRSRRYWQSEPLKHGGRDTFKGNGGCLSVGVCHEVSGQCRDSLCPHRAPRTSSDRLVTCSQMHTKPLTREAALVHEFEKYSAAYPKLSRTPLTRSLTQNDSLQPSQTPVPAVDGETRAPQECSASTSSVLSLRSLPTVLRTHDVPARDEGTSEGLTRIESACSPATTTCV